MADKTYTVTVASGTLYPSGTGTGSVYYLDGVRDLDITWTQGATLRFNQDDATNDGHPLLFTNDSSNPNSGRIETGVVYNLDGSTVPYSSYASGSFNSATTRYVEITPASAQDLFYYCFYHGLRMGGELDIVNDGWSSLSWSTGQWGDQDNAAPQVTGFPLSLSLQSVTTDAEVNAGWGRRTWGADQWGAATNTDAFPNGIGMSASLGSVTIGSEINTGWGRDAWNTGSWGVFGTVLPTGIQMSSSLGSVTIGTQVKTGWGRAEWGNEPWGLNETVLDVQVTGFPLSLSLGNEGSSGEVNTGWGRKEWGHVSWNNPG